jgi:anthraniloyl-CoA monooxygenase
VKIGCIGAGPAGLYLGILIKRAAPAHDVVIYERDVPATRPGLGVIFPEGGLDALAAADAASAAAIADNLIRVEDVEVHHRGDVIRSTGHGLRAIGRARLFRILEDRARHLGVAVRYGTAIATLDDIDDADVVVGADGAHSIVRDELAADLEPSVDVRPMKVIGLATTAPFRGLTYQFKHTAHGLMRVHAFPHAIGEATFLVECTEATWAAAGFADADDERTAALLEAYFADELGGHRLFLEPRGWQRPTIVRCRTWRSRSTVVIGDAAHAMHYSNGAGVQLAMEDAIALADGLLFGEDVPSALAAYEGRRRREVDAAMIAAEASRQWFERAERYAVMVGPQLAYHLLTRTLAPSHQEMARRDPSLAWSVELVLAGRMGIVPDPEETRPLRPGQVPFAVPGLKTPNRIAVVSRQPSGSAVGVLADEHLAELGAAARTGAGLVLTPPIHLGAGTGPGIQTDEEVVAWSRIVDFIHDRTPARCGALIAACKDSAMLADAATRAARAKFDLLIVDVTLPETRLAMVAVGVAWPSDRALGIRVSAAANDDAVLAAQRALAAGHTLCWVASAGDDLAAVVLADRIRFEVGIATAVGLRSSTSVDLDALIASGRADLVVVDRGLEPGRRP